MRFLGTGAAELIPNPLCGCALCRRAASSGNPKDRRRRTSLLLDEENLLDCGPDTLNACNEFGISLAGLKNLFLTHTHDDHLDLRFFDCIRMSCAPRLHLEVYATEAACANLLRLRDDLRPLSYMDLGAGCDALLENCTLHPLPFYVPHPVDDFLVTPMRARHRGMFREESGASYLFSKGGRSALIAFDTGLFYEETYAYLADRPVDLLIIDGTFGATPVAEDYGHLNCEHLEQVLRRLYRQNTLTSASRIIITHISHRGNLLHEEYAARMKALFGDAVSISFDGMVV